MQDDTDWHETTITLRWHDDAISAGGKDRCCPSSLEELVIELDRRIGQESMGSYGGGLVRLHVPNAITKRPCHYLQMADGHAREMRKALETSPGNDYGESTTKVQVADAARSAAMALTELIGWLEQAGWTEHAINLILEDLPIRRKP
jgi:hypothetical protein